LKPYRLSGFQSSGEKIRDRFAEADRLEAGGLNPLGGKLKGYDFWLRSTAKTLDEVYPGQAWKFWQYTATGRVQGIAGDVDLNAFSGSPETWKAWLAARSVR